MTATTINFGAANDEVSDRRLDFTMPALPNGDWSFNGWFRIENTMSGRDRVFTLGEAGGTPSLALAIAPDDSSIWPVGADGAGPGGLALPGNFAEDVDTFWCVQRRGANLEWYVAAKGSTISAPNFTIAHGLTAGFTSGPMRIGSADGFGHFQNPMGEFAIHNAGSYSIAQLNTLAAGAHVTAVLTPVVDLRLRSSNATETNLGSGGAAHDATRHGTGWTTATEFFADTAAPILSGASPANGTVTGANPTISATTDTTSGTARIVIDSAANLDAVTGPQILAGNHDGGTSAAYNSGTITLSSTSVSHAFSGLAAGNYTWAMAQSGGSNILKGTITVSISGSMSISLDSAPGVPLANTQIYVWTKNTKGGPVVDGGVNGISITLDASGNGSVPGLSIGTGARWVQYQIGSDDYNIHLTPVTVS